MSQKLNEIQNFGEVRQFLLQTALDIRDKKITPEDGLAIAATIKVMNDNIKQEIDINKLAIQTHNTLFSTGDVVRLGKRTLSDEGLT